MKIAVIFGGRSCEHNVSIVTGVQAINDFPPEHKAVPVYIDEKGVWHTGKDYADISIYKSLKGGKYPGKEVYFMPSSPYLYGKGGKKLCRIDCALICNHGINGEDGCIQGLLRLTGIPFTGSNVLASAAGMDKSVMKKLFISANLPVLPYVTVTADSYVNNSMSVIEKIKSNLAFPLIVKPSNLGSSIGIKRATDYSELFAAIRTALEWDTSAVIENAVTDFCEYNCAVLCGEASEVERPVTVNEILSYEDKYLLKSGVRREFPAKINDKLANKIKDFAVEAYNAVGAEGIARVDFLYDGNLYVNEINTVPGSLASYFYKGGCKYVINKLINQALKSHEARMRLKYSYKPFKGEGIKK